MTKIAFPLHSLPPENRSAHTIGKFITLFARLLRQQGEEVTLVVVREEPQSFPIDERWREEHRALGLELIEVQDKQTVRSGWTEIWPMRISEELAAILRRFDVVYFAACADLAIHTIRTKRFTAEAMPVCVTVLHRSYSSILEADRRYPDIPRDLNLQFLERYCARHSDLVISTNRQTLDRVRRDGWRFTREPEVLPLPDGLETAARPGQCTPQRLAHDDFAAVNETWWAFHNRARTLPRRTPPPAVLKWEPSVHPSVDICVTYYNKTRYFPQLLESLEHQTTQDFSVIAVDDGSPDPEARATFDRMAEKYAPRGWIFFRQPNSYVDAARNRAAERARAEYLLMIDADDAFARNAVERFLEAARFSGDDCLVSAGYLFAGDSFPYDMDTGELTAPLFARYMPLGADVVAGLIDPRVFGGPAILIRRRVFEAIGGYREIRGSAHEDWELHARLALAGYNTDVLPEYLHYYRQVEDGLARTADDFLAKQRIIETYDRHLGSVGLYGAGTAMYALYRQCRELANHVQKLERERGTTKRPFRSFGRHDGLQAFADDNDGPWLIRVMRRMYRRTVPLDTRLCLYYRVMKLIGRNGQR